MVLRAEVIKAFEVLGVSPDTDEITASRAYKKLALRHHPDRNHNDTTSTARFQEIGAAWDICTRHYENPRWSQAPEPGTQFWGRHTGAGMYYDDDDDYYEMDAEDQSDFFRFMFYESFMGGYNRSKRQRFRSERHQPFSTYPGFSSSYSYYPQNSHNSSYPANCFDPATGQQRYQQSEKKKYEERMRQFEAEIEAEEREIKKAEREEKLKVEQWLSAHAEAFQLARAGDSAGVRSIIEKHCLDVNAPERLAKQQKKNQATSTNFTSLLHVAASHCDEELVAFLLDKDADMSTLNKENLSPFHLSILSGNTSVVRFFLTRRAKPIEGCHPSKAVADGRTPLQLAIASNSISTIELLLKDATVHDVDRCWQQENVPATIKDVLETKKGFVPRFTSTDGLLLSRKAQMKAEAVRKLAAQQEDKAKRIAEERARAAENLRRKEERAAKRTEEARIKEEARRKLEEEERRRTEEAQVAEEQRRRRELEARIKAEEEAARRKAEAEEQRRMEQEALGREIERRRRAEQEAIRRQEQEERRKVLELQARQKMEAETLQKALDRREAERQRAAHGQREADERQREAEQQQRTDESEARAMAARAQLQESNRADPAEEKHAETLRRLQAQAEGPKRLKLQRQQGQTVHPPPSPLVADSKREEIVPQQPAHITPAKVRKPHITAATPLDGADPETRDEILRLRNEQSTRDKIRIARLREQKAMERAKLANEEHEPSAVVADSQKKKRAPRVGKPLHKSYPLTPSSLSSSPQPWPAGQSYASNAPTETRAILPSPPVTPEDLQTCAIPDDLFLYERPKPKTQIVYELYSPSPPSSNTRRDVQGPSRGRGGRGHRRGRGGFIVSRDGSNTGKYEVEQVLARKEREIERLNAEIAALRSSAF